MKYLAIFSTILSFGTFVVLLVLGIRLDVLLADVMTLYLSVIGISMSSFVVSLVMLLRSLKKKDPDPVV